MIEAAFEEALTTVAAAGLPVLRVHSPPSDRTVAVAWATMASSELAESLAGVRDRWDELDPVLRDQVEFGGKVTVGDYIGAQRLRHEVTARFDELLGADSVLVVPTVNALSWPPEGPLPTSVGTVRNDPSVAVNTLDLNFTGHPAMSVPLGRDPAGVPFGLQIVAPRFADGLAFGLAQVLERERPWPLVAEGYTLFWPW